MAGTLPVGSISASHLRLVPGSTIHYDFASTSSYPRTGGTVYDISGQGNNGTINGNLTYTSSYAGAAVFDGKSSFIITGAIPYTGSATNSYTMGVWLSPTTSYGNVVSMSQSFPASAWQMPPISIFQKHFRGKVWNNNYLDGTPFSMGSWYYVVLVWNYSAGSQTLYVNGIQVATQTGITYGSSGVNNYLGLGQRMDSAAEDRGWFKGYMGNFHFYGNQALTLTQIQQNYNALQNRYLAAIQPEYVTSSLGLYVDTNVVTSLSAASTTWTDISGNGLNATSTSSAYISPANGFSSSLTNTAYPFSTATTGLLNTDTHTISFFIKFNSTTTYPSGTSGNWDKIFGYDPSGTDRSPGIWRWPSNRYIHWRYDPSNTGNNIGPTGTTGDTTPATEFDLDTWWHITGTKNGGTFTVYINGVNSGSYANISATKTAGTSAINILEGYTQGASNIGASVQIDGVMVYNRVLSNQEVAQNYNALAGRYSLAPTTSGLVFSVDASNPACYSGSGSTVYELSGRNYSGTMSNVTYTTDRGGYWGFNGTNSSIVFTNDTALDTSTFTQEVWIKTNNLNQNGFFIEKGAVNTEYSLFQEGTSLVFRTETPSLVDIRPVTATYLTTNDWNHIVGSYSSGTKKFYINGVLITTATTTGSITANSLGVSLGAYGTGGYYYNGYIGEARIYNRQLSDAEVLSNYNNTKARYKKLNLPGSTAI
jgi:hypothetical protein